MTTPAPRQPTSSSPVLTLILAAVASALPVAVVEVWHLAAGIGIGRVSELAVLWRTRHFLEGWDIDIDAHLPRKLHVPFALDHLAGLLTFITLTSLTLLVIYCVVALALAPMAAAVHRRQPTWRGWDRTFPIASAMIFWLPTMYVRIDQLLQRGSKEAIVFTAGLAVLLTFGVLLVTGKRDLVRRCIRVAAICSIVLTAAIGVTAALLHRSVEQPAAAAGAPNILLISIDSLRADHVRSYGYERETTPVLDQLARQGGLFRTVVSPTSWTLPAHLSLLTSLTPEEHGVVADGLQIDGRRTTFLAEVLWRGGYETAGFVSGPYLDAINGFNKGFDLYDDYSVAKINYDASHRSVTSPGLVNLVTRWLHRWDSGKRRRPFFIFLHMWDVHYDYVPPPPYDQLFDPQYHGTIDGKNFIDNPRVARTMDRRDLDHIVALYDGEIRFTDLHVGKVLSKLQELGVFDQTIVVVTADHGDEFFEHGNKGHAKTLYDESLLVPLIMRYPAKIRAGTVVDSQVRLTDVAPTILSLAGIPRPASFGAAALDAAQAGHDLTPWIHAVAPTPLPALLAFGDMELADAPRKLAAVRTQTHKLIRALQAGGDEELYDVQKDPGEQTNLIHRNSTQELSLSQTLDGWRHAAADPSRAARPVQIGEEQRERLRALGYMR
ncbi:MAG: sulfatase [Deltaproteobacteria bacterium]|nr:sulfatase [Deltaproteobacteria bacterium]